jgi:alpha-D-ribose 1-methylphosphonate 5-triphosphate synthase subunit PhnH
MGMALAEIGAGLARPVEHAQQVFRALLQAMARPGCLQHLPHDALAGLQAPAALQPATAALLLALLDADTRLHLAGRLQREEAARYFGFHCGLRIGSIEEADFVVAAAADADAALWQRVRDGTDLAPQTGATLVIEVPRLERQGAGGGLLLNGPGIRGTQRLAVGGLDAAFWRARVARQADFPRGVDLVLVCGAQIAALPRTTQIVLEG